MDYALSEIFNTDLGGKPATYIEDYTVAVPIEHEITVVFKREIALDNFGVATGTNAEPIVWTLTDDVPNISNNSKMLVHYGNIADENGEDILDEAGETIIAENEYVYFVKYPFADTFGITESQLSLTQPK